MVWLDGGATRVSARALPRRRGASFGVTGVVGVAAPSPPNAEREMETDAAASVSSSPEVVRPAASVASVPEVAAVWASAQPT